MKNTITAPDLEGKINEVVDDAKKLILDFAGPECISGAGLCVLLGAAQAMEDKRDMVVRNLTQPVREVFELTGFSCMFNIEYNKAGRDRSMAISLPTMIMRYR